MCAALYGYCFSPSFWNLVIQNIREMFEIPVFFYATAFNVRPPHREIP